MTALLIGLGFLNTVFAIVNYVEGFNGGAWFSGACAVGCYWCAFT